MQSGLDYDDFMKLEAMCNESDYIINIINKASTQTSDKEVELNLAIASHNIKDSLTWKKQIIELIKQDDIYASVYTKYMESKNTVLIHQSLLRALETRINCLKKKIGTTPAI